MKALFPKRWTLELTLLLCCLPFAAFALADNIVSQMLLLLLSIGVGILLLIIGVGKASAGLIKMLAREETPASAEAVAGGRPAIRFGLALRVLLLALLPNLVWFYLSAGPAAAVAEALGLMTALLRALVLYVVFGVPTAVLAWRLWHTRRPSMAVGIALSPVLILVVLTGIGWANERPYPAGPAARPQHQRPDPDPGLVYDQADPMPVVVGGRDSLRAVLSSRLHPVWLARNDYSSGRLYIRYTVTAAGHAAHVSARGPMLIYDSEAAQVLAEWAFVPGRRNGQAATVWDTVSFAFRKPAGRALPK